MATSEYPGQCQVVRIGEMYTISVPYGAGYKRLQMKRGQLEELARFITATLANEAKYQRNGKTVGRENARYQRLP